MDQSRSYRDATCQNLSEPQLQPQPRSVLNPTALSWPAVLEPNPAKSAPAPTQTPAQPRQTASAIAAIQSPAQPRNFRPAATRGQPHPPPGFRQKEHFRKKSVPKPGLSVKEKELEAHYVTLMKSSDQEVARQGFIGIARNILGGIHTGETTIENTTSEDCYAKTFQKFRR